MRSPRGFRNRARRKTVMKPVFGMAGRCRGRAATAICGLLLTATASPVRAAGCAFEPQGEGRVAAVIDARSFRLADGRDILLAGIEPVASDKAAGKRASALSAMLTGREVTLRGEDDTPDRYGREPAFVFLVPAKTAPAETSPAEILVQAELLAQGEALVSATVADKECAAVLTTAEAAARQARRGIWGDPAAIKSTESPGDILAGIGRFTVVEGKVLSVRQAGQRLT